MQCSSCKSILLPGDEHLIFNSKTSDQRPMTLYMCYDCGEIFFYLDVMKYPISPTDNMYKRLMSHQRETGLSFVIVTQQQ